MMERHFEHVLENLKRDLIGMAGLVNEQLDAAYSALFDDNLDMAQRVITQDAEVDAWDTRIDSECQEILAVVQPVAVDLRLLMTVLKINGQLERIGDIAVNIAERVRVLSGYREFLRATRLQEMAEIARIMVRDSLDAINQNNPVIAMRVLESDDVVDALDRHIFQHLVREMKTDHRVIEPASHIMILSRHLERLADHATNIAEDVIFLVEAKIVKHHALDTPDRES
jgi:phosphate transport system protein